MQPSAEAHPKTPTSIDRQVGQRLRMRRRMLGVSQMRLASMIGLTFQQVQKYEKGTNRLGASRLYQIAQALQVPVSYFFDDLSNVPVEPSRPMEVALVPVDYISDFLANADALLLAKAFMKIRDARIRRQIVRLVEQIVADDQPKRFRQTVSD
ncbi:MAG TPA: helix-turn-helix transcriptional regulator [Xanthobacteraceae bacterium]|nr:helix-turn-helix transcriptional regulator [Xanthobacteraceae bacterium]